MAALSCPCCHSGAADKAALDEMLWDLISERGLSEDAEGVLRTVWAGAGRPVGTEAIWDEMYAWDPDGGPSPALMYTALKAALTELDTALQGTGLGIIKAEQRGTWRLVMWPGAYTNIPYPVAARAA